LAQLYRALEGEGGVARYIQRRRLAESIAILSDASNVAPVGAIAEALCFADASSFSRAFRREFGASPSDVRSLSRSRVTPVKKPEGSSPPDADSFAECLRSF